MKLSTQILSVLISIFLLCSCISVKPLKQSNLPEVSMTPSDVAVEQTREKMHDQIAETAQAAKTELTKIPITPSSERVRLTDGAIELLIPAGEFIFGCLQEHNGGFDCLGDELPGRTLYLEAYYIDKHEITNAQYALCVRAGGCSEPSYRYSATRDSYYDNPAFNNFPVVNTSWHEASAYCVWAGGRLPTEAEWEKAARGTDDRAFPWGDETPNCSLANSRQEITGSNCEDDTAAVGTHPEGASPYGVMDMAGNVWEWVQDSYVLNQAGVRLSVDPFDSNSNFNKVVKGGSWDYAWSRLRIAYNSDHNPNEHKVSFGFRCVNPID